MNEFYKLSADEIKQELAAIEHCRSSQDPNRIISDLRFQILAVLWTDSDCDMTAMQLKYHDLLEKLQDDEYLLTLFAHRGHA